MIVRDLSLVLIFILKVFDLCDAYYGYRRYDYDDYPRVDRYMRGYGNGYNGPYNRRYGYHPYHRTYGSHPYGRSYGYQPYRRGYHFRGRNNPYRQAMNGREWESEQIGFPELKVHNFVLADRDDDKLNKLKRRRIKASSDYSDEGPGMGQMLRDYYIRKEKEERDDYIAAKRKEARMAKYALNNNQRNVVHYPSAHESDFFGINW